MAAASWNDEAKWKRRCQTRRLNKAKNKLQESPIGNIDDVQYLAGGWIEFDPNRGEVMVPECVQFKLKNDDDLASLSLISKLTERFGLKVVVPEYKQTWGSPTVVRLTINYSQE
jgi:hypothetical protein